MCVSAVGNVSASWLLHRTGSHQQKCDLVFSKEAKKTVVVLTVTSCTRSNNCQYVFLSVGHCSVFHQWRLLAEIPVHPNPNTP